MENAIPKKPEIIPVGTGRDDVEVLLVVFGPTETAIIVKIAAESVYDADAKNRAEQIRNQEALSLRHVGYELAGKPVQFREKLHGKRVTVETFKWSDWKWGIMKMKKPC